LSGIAGGSPPPKVKFDGGSVPTLFFGVVPLLYAMMKQASTARTDVREAGCRGEV
jgi:hypothetical protein